jgi:hypothetical protein
MIPLPRFFSEGKDFKGLAGKKGKKKKVKKEEETNLVDRRPYSQETQKLVGRWVYIFHVRICKVFVD